VETKSAIVEIPVIRPRELKALQRSAAYLETVWSRFDSAKAELIEHTKTLRGLGDGRLKGFVPVRPETPQIAAPRPSTLPPARPRRHSDASTPIQDKCQRAVMTVLVQQGMACPIGKLALLAGYRVSGGFRNALGGLRTAGYLDGPNTGFMVVTEAGKQALGGVEPLPSPGPALVGYWLKHPSLGKCERAILSVLVGCTSTALDIKALADKAGYEVSGGFRNSLSTLRRAGLIVGGNTEAMRASDGLF